MMALDELRYTFRRKSSKTLRSTGEGATHGARYVSTKGSQPFSVFP